MTWTKLSLARADRLALSRRYLCQTARHGAAARGQIGPLYTQIYTVGSLTNPVVGFREVFSPVLVIFQYRQPHAAACFATQCDFITEGGCCDHLNAFRYILVKRLFAHA